MEKGLLAGGQSGQVAAPFFKFEMRQKLENVSKGQMSFRHSWVPGQTALGVKGWTELPVSAFPWVDLFALTVSC
jgi:hypothetical protein